LLGILNKEEMKMDKQKNICINCQNCIVIEYPVKGFYKCKKAEVINYVTGEVDYLHCVAVNLSGNCKHYEEKKND